MFNFDTALSNANSNGLALHKIIERAGVSHSSFYRWKNGEQSPRLDECIAIAAALEIDLLTFIAGGL